MPGRRRGKVIESKAGGCGKRSPRNGIDGGRGGVKALNTAATLASGSGVLFERWMSTSLIQRGLVLNGPPPCTKLSLSVSIFPSSERRLGIGVGSLFWYHSLGRCRVCTKQVTHQDGILCANFGHQVGQFPICHSAWCPDCYREIPGVSFLVYRAKDTGGNDMMAPGEEDDYRGARPGDHLVCSFDCDACAFFRLKGCLPVLGNHSDDRTLCLIRRVNLDTFWSRKKGTVRRQLGILKEQVAIGERHGITIIQPREPFPAHHEFGMRMAIDVLEKSLKAGRHEAMTKYSNVRKITSLHTNMYKSSALGAASSTLILRAEKKRLYSSQSPHDSDFFVMFMAGLRARVGERRKQDAAISIALMVEMQRRLELDWNKALERDDLVEMREVAEHAVNFLFCFCGALCGFEGTKVPLHELRSKVALDASCPGAATDSLGLFMPHVGIPLVGAFKARSVGNTELLIFVAAQTASGLRPGEWTKRLVDLLTTLGIFDGWLFQTADGAQQPMSHFEERFYDLLILISSDKATAHLFADGIDILEDYHLARSFRRGATTRATNAGVTEDDIDWLCRWNTGGEETGGAPLRVLYSDRTQLLETYLRFYLPL
jgi:hypothetical protein